MTAKTCRYTIYINEPYGEGPSNGHVFFSLTDAKGVERVYGFHADTFMKGNTCCPKTRLMAERRVQARHRPCHRRQRL